MLRRPILKSKSVDYTHYEGQEIALQSKVWHSSGYEIKAIVPSSLEVRGSAGGANVFCRGEFLVLSSGARVKTTQNFWLESGTARLAGSHDFFTELDFSEPIIDRIIGKVQCNGPWIVGFAIDEYKSIDLESELGRALIQPCLEEFGSLDALAEVPAIKEAKENKNTGSVGWGHRSID
jgi:hypothetical protein